MTLLRPSLALAIALSAGTVAPLTSSAMARQESALPAARPASHGPAHDIGPLPHAASELPVLPGPSSALAGCPCTTGTPENEADCGLYPDGSWDEFADTVNGGCNSMPPVFSPISVGDTICGTVAWDIGTTGGFRDLDWFELELTETTTVTFSVEAEFDCRIGYFDSGGVPDCSSLPPFNLVDTGIGCGDTISVSGRLTPGKWWFIVFPIFGQSSLPCGTQYTARLFETCETFTDAAAFDASVPGLTVEDFADGNVSAGAACTSALDPVDTAGDGGGCFDPGDITGGLSVGSGGSGLTLLGTGAACGGGSADSASITPVAAGDAIELTFEPQVSEVGFLVETCSGTARTLEIELIRGGGSTLETSSATFGATPGFWGVTCAAPFQKVRISDPSGVDSAIVDDIRFVPTRCAAISDAALFDSLYPDLKLERFQDGNVAPMSSTSCGDPSINQYTDDACFDSGDIEPGIQFTAYFGAGLSLIGANAFGPGHSKLLGPSVLPDEATIEFDPPVRQVGLDVYVQSAGTVEIEVRTSTNNVLETHVVQAGPSGAFWGTTCTAPVNRLRIRGLSGGFEAFDNLRFGDSPRTLGARYCTPNTDNSTGQPGRMVVVGSTVDADDDLTLAALDLPTNSNIGYFVMGTGTNMFQPPGASGRLCVAPGIQRFLPPVNNTNQLPGGFSRVVGTQGNGHPISAAITPGSTWNFQAWHRDSMAGTSNLTDAVSVTFL